MSSLQGLTTVSSRKLFYFYITVVLVLVQFKITTVHKIIILRPSFTVTVTI